MPVTTRKVKSSSKTLKEELEQKEVNDILDLVEKLPRTCSKTRKRSRTPNKNSTSNSENTENLATKSNSNSNSNSNAHSNSNEKTKEMQPHSKKLPNSPAIRKSSKEKFEADHQKVPVTTKNRRKLVKTEDYSGGTVHGFGGYKNYRPHFFCNSINFTELYLLSGREYY